MCVFVCACVQMYIIFEFLDYLSVHMSGSFSKVFQPFYFQIAEEKQK